MTDLLFSDPGRFVLQFVLLAPAFLIAITVHEVAHGLVASLFGDPTARAHGRLTLNPLPHIDPLGAVIFVLSGFRFGWAKPVPVNAYNLRNPRRDMVWIAAAGPVSNFLVAMATLATLTLVAGAGDRGSLVFLLCRDILSGIYLINVGLGVFNLIPLPPLDGGHFLPYFLPRASWSSLHQLEQYGPLILLVAMFAGATRYVVAPAVQAVDHLLQNLVGLFLSA